MNASPASAVCMLPPARSTADSSCRRSKQARTSGDGCGRCGSGSAPDSVHGAGGCRNTGAMQRAVRLAIRQGCAAACWAVTGLSPPRQIAACIGKPSQRAKRPHAAHAARAGRR
eukprot:365325-Chlamydomonas_euryale.AAC.35